jgi:hypothetical protein
MREVILNVDEKKIVAKIRPLKYSELNKIREACSEVQLIGGMTKATINVFKMQAMIVNTIVSLSDGKLDDLPAKEVVKLEEICLEDAGLGANSFPEGSTPRVGN